MSTALPGQHYCEEHQGNHSHYAPDNCTVCKLEGKLAEALEENQKLNDDIDNICAALGQVAEDAKGCYHIALGIMTAHKRKPEGDGG